MVREWELPDLVGTTSDATQTWLSWGKGYLCRGAPHFSMYLTLPSYSLSPPLFFWVLLGECLVTGQSHFKSFDNRYFTFSGICQYQLARDCQDHSFSIVIETVQVSSARLPVRGQQSLMVRRQGCPGGLEHLSVHRREPFRWPSVTLCKPSLSFPS